MAGAADGIAQGVSRQAVASGLVSGRCGRDGSARRRHAGPQHLHGLGRTAITCLGARGLAGPLGVLTQMRERQHVEGRTRTRLGRKRPASSAGTWTSLGASSRSIWTSTASPTSMPAAVAATPPRFVGTCRIATLWTEGGASVELGPTFDVWRAFAHFGRLEPGIEFGNMHGLAHASDELLGAEYLHRLCADAGRFRATHGQELDDFERQLLELGAEAPD